MPLLLINPPNVNGAALTRVVTGRFSRRVRLGTDSGHSRSIVGDAVNRSSSSESLFKSRCGLVVLSRMSNVRKAGSHKKIGTVKRVVGGSGRPVVLVTGSFCSGELRSVGPGYRMVGVGGSE